MDDYYSILGVSREATADEIKKAFRKLAHEHHPDKGGTDVKFKKINEAYQILSDPEKRRRYDQFGSAEEAPVSGGFHGFGGQNINFDFGGFEDLGDIFSSFGFGGGRGFKTRTSQKQNRGSDIQIKLDLTLLDVLTGLKRSLEISRDAPCADCHGTGAKNKKMKICPTCDGTGVIIERHKSFFGLLENRRACSTCHGRGQVPEQNCGQCHGAGLEHQRQKVEVAIPSGIADGQTIRYAGLGNAILNGVSGDLLVTVGVIPDKRFNRDGLNLKTEKVASLPLLFLGGEVTIETLTGPLKLKIPPQTLSGAIFRLKEQGLPKLNSKTRGDMYILIKLAWPKKITNKIKKAVEEISDDLLNEGEKIF